MTAGGPALLSGVVDTHVHTSPDIRPRTHTDAEYAAEAWAAGMAAVVLKNHYEPTVARAAAAAKAAPGLAVLGGLVLNHAACGGFNPEASAVALTLGARVIWMPTFSARNHKDYLRRSDGTSFVAGGRFETESEGLSPVNDSGKVIDSVLRIIDHLAEHDAVLATGHLSADESTAVITEAHSRGARRFLVTHPESPQIAMGADVQRDLAKFGTMFEHCYLPLTHGYDIARLVDEIRAVGVEHSVIATDFGRVDKPSPVAGMRLFGEALVEAGLSEQEWRTVASANALRLLGLRYQASVTSPQPVRSD